MKKTISVLLSLTMLLCLCSCGNKKEKAPKELSKEEMLSQAEDVRLDNLLHAVENNMARAKESYNDKLIKIENFRVDSIDSYDDYAAIKMTYWPKANSVITITANIPNSEAMTINTADTVTVCGTMKLLSSAYAQINDAHIFTE